MTVLTNQKTITRVVEHLLVAEDKVKKSSANIQDILAGLSDKMISKEDVYSKLNDLLNYLNEK